tara:strand:+ start:463 stop:1734 length:1272 start_codon:yes stop_codon:yes gene_type:complete
MENIDIKKKFLIFIIFNIFYAVFYLYTKHSVGNDSSISEWLINYQGGFTRRGLGGELSISIANLLKISLRESIFYIQSIIHVFYLVLVFNYIKNIKINIIQLFALFAPIFLLYPIAELEVLGRKEMLLFLFFIGLLFFAEKKFTSSIINCYTFVLLPFVCFIWEEVVLFAPFIATVIIIKNNLITFKRLFIKLSVIFLPTIVAMLIIFLFPLSREGHDIMCNFLSTEFNERCYMSASLLMKHSIYFENFYAIHEHVGLQNYLRYILIFLIGFLPLNILVSQNQFTKKNNFITKYFKLNILFFILYSPSILLFLFASDWARWINITYTFSILLYFYMLKNSIITNRIYINESLKKNFLKKKKILILIFFLFAFFWNPKTSITGDIATNSLYKIVYNSTKKILSFDSIRIFQNNPIIKFHKNYIE